METTPPPLDAPPSGGSGREREEDEDDMPTIKRRRLEVPMSDGEDSATQSRSVSPWQQTPSTLTVPEVARPLPPAFSDKLIEQYQDPVHPSATPFHLQNRFMV